MSRRVAFWVARTTSDDLPNRRGAYSTTSWPFSMSASRSFSSRSRSVNASSSASAPKVKGLVAGSVFRMTTLRNYTERSERCPDLQLCARARDHLIGELGCPLMPAEVGSAGARRDRLEAGLTDRATGALGLVTCVREERRAREDHRHRVRDVLPPQGRCSPVGGLGHDR